MTRQRAVERSALAAPHVAAPGGGAALGRPLPDPEPRDGRRQPEPRRSRPPSCRPWRCVSTPASPPAGRRASGRSRPEEFFRTPADHGARADRAPDRGVVPVRRRAGPGSAWLELARRHGDYALVGVGGGGDARGRPDRGGAARPDRGGGPAGAGAARPRRGSPASPHAGGARARPPRRSAGRSIPGATSTRPRRIAVTSPACSARGRSGSPRRARRTRRACLTAAPMEVRLRVNGREHAESVPPRLLLSDFLRHRLGLTGHPRRLRARRLRRLHRAPRRRGGAVVPAPRRPGRRRRADDRRGPRAEPDGRLHPVQQAFHEMHALQCGFCTPGFLLSVARLPARRPRALGRRDPARAGGQPLPLHRLPEHRAGRPPGRASCWRTGARPPDRRAPRARLL